MKRSHKLKAMGDVDAIVASALTLQEAAKRLGVDRSTLHRWVKAGKVHLPGRLARAPQTPAVDVVVPPADQSVESWAAAVRAEREMTATDLQLVDLAAAALSLSREPNHPMVRLSAMSRFQGLVKQLALNAAEKPAERPQAPAARRAAALMDPRRILSAVK